MLNNSEIKEFLEEKYLQYCTPSFIDSDPIQIPHSFTQKEDIEISAFLTASIAWGNRKAIIKSAKELITLLDNAPYDFITNATDKEIKKSASFYYRTFQPTDSLFFIKSIQNIYKKHNGLEEVFTKPYLKTHSIADAIKAFRNIFFSIPYEDRTQKHIANIAKGSSAKRINMFLRWMARTDKEGVDFGIWEKISPADLHIPLDVHVGNVARTLGILDRNQNDWKSVSQLTSKLKSYCPDDPVKYDFALFGLGVFEKFH